jgi:hypothetical protein
MVSYRSEELPWESCKDHRFLTRRRLPVNCCHSKKSPAKRRTKPMPIAAEARPNAVIAACILSFANRTLNYDIFLESCLLPAVMSLRKNPPEGL